MSANHHKKYLRLEDGRSYELPGPVVVIGRNPIGNPGEYLLAIDDNTKTISKTHARLSIKGDEWVLTDLNSTNGIVVFTDDGSEMYLEPGERVIGSGRFLLGDVAFTVE